MMTAAAVTTGTPLEMNARTVVREDGVTTVCLHGVPCLRINTRKGTVMISGEALPTRKTCRMMNAVLSRLGAGTVFTRKGEWEYRSTDGTRSRFTDGALTVPILF